MKVTLIIILICFIVLFIIPFLNICIDYIFKRYINKEILKLSNIKILHHIINVILLIAVSSLLYGISNYSYKKYSHYRRTEIQNTIKRNKLKSDVDKLIKIDTSFYLVYLDDKHDLLTKYRLDNLIKLNEKVFLFISNKKSFNKNLFVFNDKILLNPSVVIKLSKNELNDIIDKYYKNIKEIK